MSYLVNLTSYFFNSLAKNNNSILNNLSILKIMLIPTNNGSIQIN
jgi:hypothetical protein